MTENKALEACWKIANHIPENWGDECRDGYVRLNISADAIEAVEEAINTDAIASTKTNIHRDAPSTMQKTLNRLLEITDGCRENMHEPDEQGLSAEFFGHRLDNAFPPTTVSHELKIKLTRGHANEFNSEYFNLATLIALARKALLQEEN